MKNLTTLTLTVFSFAFSFAQNITTNTNPVGLEHNILFNADKRFTVTQTGAAYFGLPHLFDGRFNPYYSTNPVSASSPTVITIENLPSMHTQTGAWVGWSTRYWEAKNFKIEGYDTLNGVNYWKNLADFSSQNNPQNKRSFHVKLPSGIYTKLRFTFYSSYGTNGRLGISELFFLHPEATKPYEALGLGSWTKNGNEISSSASNTILAHPTSNHTSLQIGRETNDRIIADNNNTSTNSYGSGYFFRVHDESTTHKYRNVMMLAGNGNVGIGKKPTAKLEVNGTTKIQGHTDNVEFLRFESDRPWAFKNKGTSSGSRLTLESQVDRKFFDIASKNNENKVASFFISDNVETQQVTFVAGGGKVGIGTTTPQNKLSVNGTIWAKEVKVTFEDAADWVFEKDYNLRPLTEVESYIKENKHLPEIPSAAEFRKNDLKVSEITNKLLQKIEELTLYTIAQEKKLEKIEKLENKNKALEARMAKLEALLAK